VIIIYYTVSCFTYFIVAACSQRTLLCYYNCSGDPQVLNDLYSSPNIVRVIKSRRIRWAGHVARMGEERGAYRVLVRKPEGKRPLGRPRRRWVDNIRMIFMRWDVGI